MNPIISSVRIEICIFPESDINGEYIPKYALKVIEDALKVVTPLQLFF